MTSEAKKVSIFDYLDYRLFLKDWYQSKKSLRSSVSLRSFSKKAGFTSSNYLKLVMDGDRNLSEEGIDKFAVGLSLNKKERDFFQNLVYFNQAKTHEEKDHYYRSLLQSSNFNELKPMHRDQYEFYDKWYHAVVRELIVAPEFDGTFEWIAKKIYPPLSPSEVGKSVALLERLEFLKKISDNKWQQTNPLVTTGPEPISHIIFNYHRNILSLSRDLLPEVEYSMRDISALTIGLPRKEIPILKEKIQKFREEILKQVSSYTEPEEVIMLNIQMFPVTKIHKEE